MKICVLFIATGRYIQLFDDVYKSFEKNFLLQHQKSYYLFTDSNANYTQYRNLNIIKIPWSGFPDDSLKRFHYFLSIKERLINAEIDVLYYCDVDMKVVTEIGNEFLPTSTQPLICVTHPFYFKRGLGTPETRIESKAYISPNEPRDYYICGGVSGGLLYQYLTACEIMAEWIDIDAENGIIPRYEDEGIWNRYMVSNRHLYKFYPPSYCFPNSYVINKVRYLVDSDYTLEHMEELKKSVEFLKYQPVILCVDKDHKLLRSKPDYLKLNDMDCTD